MRVLSKDVINHHLGVWAVCTHLHKADPHGSFLRLGGSKEKYHFALEGNGRLKLRNDRFNHRALHIAVRG